MVKKINKIMIYYEDGTYEEIVNSVSDVQSEKNKKDAIPSPVIPQVWPILNPYQITCTDSDVKLRYTTSSDGAVWSFKTTDNF